MSELKRHHINELSAMIKLKGGIGYPIVYYANEVDAVVAKKDAKIGKLTDKLSKTGGQIKRLADCAHVLNIELARKEKLIAEKDAEIAQLKDRLQAAEKMTAIGDWNRLCVKYNKLIELKKDFCEKFKDIELEIDK